MAEAPRRCQSDGLDVRLGSPPVLACVWILSLVLSVGIYACVDRFSCSFLFVVVIHSCVDPSRAQLSGVLGGTIIVIWFVISSSL